MLVVLGAAEVHQGPSAPVLLAEEERPDGTRREVELRFLEGNDREWSAMWHLLAAPSDAGLEAWWRAHRSGAEVKAVRLYRASVPVDPAQQRRIERGPLLAELHP